MDEFLLKDTQTNPVRQVTIQEHVQLITMNNIFFTCTCSIP